MNGSRMRKTTSPNQAYSTSPVHVSTRPEVNYSNTINCNDCLNLKLKGHSSILHRVMNNCDKSLQAFTNTRARSVHSSRRAVQLDAMPVTPHDPKMTIDYIIIYNDRSDPERRSNVVDIEKVVEYLREENAIDTCVIKVPPDMDYVEYFVICSGYGTRHLRRMADGLVEKVHVCSSLV